MEYVNLGRSGLKVSRYCLGTMNFGTRTSVEESGAIMRRSLTAGLLFWDTANSYSKTQSEEIIGSWLKEHGAREQVVLASKFVMPTGKGPNDRGASRRHILLEVEKSLRRLKTDWIDLYQIHRLDPTTPFEETAEALHDCVRAGKIRHWGTSTFPAWRLCEAWWTANARGWARPISEQGPYNLLDRRIEIERIPYMQEYGIGLMVWAPLAAGLLTGKYGRDADNPPPGSRFITMPGPSKGRVGSRTLDTVEVLGELAAASGIDRITFAIAWLAGRPGVTSIILGPASVEQYEAYMNALNVQIPADVLRRVDEIVPPGTAVADFHNNSGWFTGAVL